MDSALMFPDSPAHPDRGSAKRFGLPAKMQCRFVVAAAACARVTVTGRGDARASAPARGRRQPQEVER
jgi:hypothetical protein